MPPKGTRSTRVAGEVVDSPINKILSTVRSLNDQLVGLHSAGMKVEVKVSQRTEDNAPCIALQVNVSS